VVISVLNGMQGVVVHSVLLVAIAWLLFRRGSAEYFAGGAVGEREG